MPLVTGMTAAGFGVVRQLEYGDFGELYVVQHPRLPRLQLLQLIPAEISADLDYREDFNQETDLAATLWHPNILGLTDRGEYEDQLWISTDYIEGSDAAQLLGNNHPDGMPPKQVIQIASAVAAALDYAHDHGVLHRHVNPGNILVSKALAGKRRIALSGFGVARPIGDKTNTLTRPKIIIGTASYAAPEQLIDDTPDGRSDQYSLAASVFHLLTGSPPFAHFNPAVVVSKHLSERPPRPSDFRADLTEFDAIFARGLAQDPVDRFRRCRDFARALELNGGTRSHVRATTGFHRVPDPRGTGTTAAARTASKNNGVVPTEPAPLVPRVTTVPRRDGHPKHSVDTVAKAIEPAPVDDDVDGAAARSRRTKHTAAIAGTILVVVVAWFLGVRALRTASQSDDTPTSVEPTTEPAVAPAMVSPSLIAPVPSPPVSGPPPLVTTSATATTSTSAAPVTTTRPTSTSTRTTTTPSKTTAPTTTPRGLDTRPALGMPCGPEQSGAVAISNGGGPVNCVRTPGGFAWEPPGVPSEG